MTNKQETLKRTIRVFGLRNFFITRRLEGQRRQRFKTFFMTKCAEIVTFHNQLNSSALREPKHLSGSGFPVPFKLVFGAILDLKRDTHLRKSFTETIFPHLLQNRISVRHFPDPFAGSCFGPLTSRMVLVHPAGAANCLCPQ